MQHLPRQATDPLAPQDADQSRLGFLSENARHTPPTTSQMMNFMGVLRVVRPPATHAADRLRRLPD
jgi:hypothetical protein